MASRRGAERRIELRVGVAVNPAEAGNHGDNASERAVVKRSSSRECEDPFPGYSHMDCRFRGNDELMLDFSAE